MGRWWNIKSQIKYLYWLVLLTMSCIQFTWCRSLPQHQNCAKHLASYTEKLHRVFFQEVLQRWYKPGAQPGAQLRGEAGLIPNTDGFMLSILSVFLLLMYKRNTPIPYKANNGNRSTSTQWLVYPLSLTTLLRLILIAGVHMALRYSKNLQGTLIEFCLFFRYSTL